MKNSVLNFYCEKSEKLVFPIGPCQKCSMFARMGFELAVKLDHWKWDFSTYSWDSPAEVVCCAAGASWTLSRLAAVLGFDFHPHSGQTFASGCCQQWSSISWLYSTRSSSLSQNPARRHIFTTSLPMTTMKVIVFSFYFCLLILTKIALKV